MAAQARLPEARITGLYGLLARTMSKRMLGEVPESLAVMWHHRPMLKASMGFMRKSERWSELDRSLATYAVMAAAAKIGCSFCLDLNYFMTRHHGLDPAKAREVPRWRESAVFTPLERRVMAYAEAMCVTPLEVTDELSAELLADLGAPALLELTGKVAAMNMASRTNIALGIRSQEFAAACGLPPLAPRAAAVASAS